MEKLNVLSQRLDHGDSLCDNKDMILIKPYFLAVHIIEELAFKWEEHSLLTDIQQSN